MVIKLTSGIVKFKMLEYNDQMFKCRICNTAFRSPEELRIHRMVQHKAHMLSANHRWNTSQWPHSYLTGPLICLNEKFPENL
jgi:hypothetical protein